MFVLPLTLIFALLRSVHDKLSVNAHIFYILAPSFETSILYILETYTHSLLLSPFLCLFMYLCIYKYTHMYVCMCLCVCVCMCNIIFVVFIVITDVIFTVSLARHFLFCVNLSITTGDISTISVNISFYKYSIDSASACYHFPML